LTRSIELRERIAGITGLRGVVGAMRALAAAQLRRGEEGLASIRAYADIVRGALADALAMAAADARVTAPEPVDRQVAVVFGAEHGFTGAFHAAVLDAAATTAAAGAELWIAGARAAAAAAERRLEPARVLPTATHWGGLERAAAEIAEALAGLAAGDRRVSISLIHALHGGGVATSTVLPLDPAELERRGPLPLSYTGGAAMLERLSGEYLVAQIARAAIESFTAENHARLLTMDAAYRNIERKLDELERAERQRRQDEITEELLEIVAGAGAREG
jgi:F-type H+-transporting ATPase subunit gamma